MIIKIEGPEILAVLERIATALEGKQVLPDTLEVDSKKVADTATKETKKPAPKKTQAKEDPEPEPEATEEEELGAEEPKAPEPEYTLATVRAMLSKLSQAGHQKEAKAIINSVGASRISEVDPSKYANIIEQVDAMLEHV